jgi:hypothetical protein
MKAAFISASALLLSVAVAQPHKNHMRRHEKRDVVWVTQWDTVTETLDVTATVWVTADATASPAASKSTSASSSSSSTAVAAQFFQPGSSSETTVVVKATTSTAPVAPAPTSSTSTYVQPAVSKAPAPEPTSTYVAPVQVTTTAAPVVQSSSNPVVTVAAAATTSAAAAVLSSGYTGLCASGSKCTSEITFYEAGLGACGWVNDGSVEDVVALPVGLMGSQSNGNPYCGMTITIVKDGKTVTAKVVDKCMGCVNNAIDVSNHAFDQLANESVGRTSVQWWFN